MAKPTPESKDNWWRTCRYGSCVHHCRSFGVNNMYEDKHPRDGGGGYEWWDYVYGTAK